MKLPRLRTLPIIEVLFVMLVVAGFVVADARTSDRASPPTPSTNTPTGSCLQVPADHYVATGGSIDPVADAHPYRGAPWPRTRGGSGTNRVGVFVDLSGYEASCKVPVGEFSYNDIGRWITETDDLTPLRVYLQDAGAFLGSDEPAIAIYRYPTGGYGSLLPSGRLHAAYARMMSTPWLDGPSAERNLAAMMSLCEKSRAAGIDFMFYLGTTPINDRGRWWDTPGAIKVSSLAVDLGARGILIDYLSGADSVSGKPTGANWQNASQAGVTGWPYQLMANEQPGTTFKVPDRVEGIADKFMLALQSSRPSVPHFGESLREPGRPMYEQVGGLRMIFPAAQSNGADRSSATLPEDRAMLLADAWQRQVLNPGVPIIYHLDGDWTNKADEFRATLASLRAMPNGGGDDGGPIITATCWSLTQAGGPAAPMKKKAA